MNKETNLKFINILQHRIGYWLDTGLDLELDNTDIEHITKLITEGYNQGELNHSQDEIRGWWKII